MRGRNRRAIGALAVAAAAIAIAAPAAEARHDTIPGSPSACWLHPPDYYPSPDACAAAYAGRLVADAPGVVDNAKEIAEGEVANVVRSAELVAGFAEETVGNPVETAEDVAEQYQGFVEQITNNPACTLALDTCDSDEDGVPDKQDECDYAPADDPSGCPNRDHDNWPDYRDDCPDEPAPPSSTYGCPPPPPVPPGGDETDPPGTGPSDLDGEAATFSEPPGDDPLESDGSADSLHCPADDPYLFTLHGDYLIDTTLPQGYPAPEAAASAFLVGTRMIPRIPFALFQPGTSTASLKVYSATLNGRRLSTMSVARTADGNWNVNVFHACGSFLDTFVPVGERSDVRR